jgi:hypothetical protein
MTAGPGARVAAALGLLRDSVDEIFVAVDERADPGVAAAIASVADRVVRYPYAEPVDRPLPWLHSECRGDWVLTIDDDELPSSGLVATLHELVEAGDVTHYWLPRRWLWPDRDHFLDESPWRPDYQPRLVANDPRLLRFPTETHRPIAVLGPSRYVEHPLYHADCILNSLERRTEKAVKYERLRPGKRLAGRPINHAFYLPERRPDACVAAVPDEDRRLIQAVLEGAETAPASAPREPVAGASREQIDERWWGRPLGDAAYRAELALAGPSEALTAGEQQTLDVRVRNLGNATWRWGEDAEPEIRLAYRWYASNGATVTPEGLRTPLPADLRPGESTLVPVHVVAPVAPGVFRLVIDLVHEHVRWFGREVEAMVEVVPAPRVALVGDPTLVLKAIEELLEGGKPVEPVILDPEPDGVERRFGYARTPLLRGRGGARILLAELSRCERLVVAGDSGRPRRQRAAILAARGLGLHVETRT